MSIFWKVKSNTEYFYQRTEIQKYAKKIKRYRITDLVGEGEETAIGPTAQTLRTRPRVQLYRNIKREIQKEKREIQKYRRKYKRATVLLVMDTSLTYTLACRVKTRKHMIECRPF